MNVKKDLKLFQELKDEAYLNNDDSIQGLKEKIKIYDIDPNINYLLLTKLLDSSNHEFIENYYNLIQTLTFQQKMELFKKLNNHKFKAEIKSKTGINNKSYIDCYFSILKKIYHYFEDDLTYPELENAFKTEFFVDNSELKIPLIYGTKELIFSSLINNMYHYFILNYKAEKNTEDNDNNINNKNKLTFFENYPKIILERKKEDNIKIEEKNDKMEIENSIQYENDKISEGKKNKVFEEKCKFLWPFLKMIFDNKDFFDIFNIENYKKENEINKFQNNYEVKPNFDPLIFHLLFLDFIICIYTCLNKKDFLEKDIFEMFLESREAKVRALKIYLQDVDIKTLNGETINFKKPNDVKNEIYKCYCKNDKNKFFLFNPYEHILSKIHFNNFDLFQKDFNNKKYFSLLKYYNNNRLFNNNTLDTLFKHNIKEMLQSKIINELFTQFTHFSNFNNPFFGDKKDAFFNQVSKVILFFPFPAKGLEGFTYKNLGVIFINDSSKKKELVNSSLAIYDICKLSNHKVTFKHEIIAHYMSSICHANDKEVELKTPPNTLNDYYPLELYSDTYNSSLDAGDKGETLIFGNKIKFIFIKGALFILDNNNWNKYNIIDDFQKAFIKVNQYFENEEINIKELKANNNFIRELLTELELNEDTVKLNKNNSGFAFRNMNENYSDEEEERADKKFFLRDSIPFSQIPYQKINI